jgi:GDPmannose 4,6-dehydratase
MVKTALIFGAVGQDGSYLSELLLSKDYNVIGVTRRSSLPKLDRVEHLLDNPNFLIVEGDIVDPSSVDHIVREYKPDEIYNLAAQSHVGTSFDQPSYTFQVNTLGVLNLLESIKRYDKTIKFYQASTSEMFGSNYTDKIDEADDLYDRGVISRETYEHLCSKKFQDEDTPLEARSPYGVAKIASYHLVNNYKDAYGIYGCSGILFNHESPRRGENFVTRKITKYIGRLKRKVNSLFQYGYTNRNIVSQLIIEEFEKLKLGNLTARRDWGHAKDYVRAMWMMMQQEKPDNYVIATGKTHSVQEFLNIAFKVADLEEYQDTMVVIDPKLIRPSEVDYLCGDASKAYKTFGWVPEISFESLVKEMVNEDT